MIEQMKQGLEALKENVVWFSTDTMIGRSLKEKTDKAITSLSKTIAELERQEPVARVVLTETLELPCLQWLDLNRQFDFKGGEYLYTRPPQRKPLTDDQITALEYATDTLDFPQTVRAIEAAHGIKE